MKMHFYTDGIECNCSAFINLIIMLQMNWQVIKWKFGCTYLRGEKDTLHLTSILSDILADPQSLRLLLDNAN